MRSSTIGTALLSWSLIAGLSVSPSHAQRRPATVPHLLIPGSPFSGGDTLVSGQTWFGVYRQADGRHELRLATVRVLHEANGCSDSKVVTADPVPPLFLVSGVPNLKPGPVDTVFRGYRFLHPGEDVSWQLGRHWFNLRAYGTASAVQYGTNFTDYELRLGTSIDRYTAIQTLAHLNFGDNVPAIQWAGDIDADGRLDLLIKLPGGGYSNDIHLYLSTLARSGEQVGEAGSLYLTDC